MTKKTASLIRLSKITITNFKGIDSLELHFPVPFLSGTADALVIGSKNGVGKTSVLEACALLLMVAVLGEKPLMHMKEKMHREEMPFDFFDLLVHAGAEKAQVEGFFEVEGKESKISLLLHKNGEVSVKGRVDALRHNRLMELFMSPEAFLPSLMGLIPDPLLIAPLLYFHSSRKVREGNPEMGMLLGGDKDQWDRYPPWSRRNSVISRFKMDILGLMMSRADLFEQADNKDEDESLDKLNELLKRYAGGEIHKLRPSAGNTIDLRITKSNGKEHSSSFDGLSSGQKEIISTLYLVWRHTRNNPSIVLIDEPELHLNAEWHGDLIRQLHLLAPHNQYIIATHSEYVAESVPKEQRALLSASEEEV